MTDAEKLAAIHRMIKPYLDETGDREARIMNAADGGNHDDTFRAGESYGETALANRLSIYLEMGAE